MKTPIIHSEQAKALADQTNAALIEDTLSKINQTISNLARGGFYEETFNLTNVSHGVRIIIKQTLTDSGYAVSDTSPSMTFGEGWISVNWFN